MEACSSAHHWARELVGLGHNVRLIPPQYVKPYVKRNKTDAADAEAICEAVGRPNMRFVPIKTRSSRAAGASSGPSAAGAAAHGGGQFERGLLGEFGVVAAKGIRRVDELQEPHGGAGPERHSHTRRGSHRGPVRPSRALHGAGRQVEGRSSPGTRPARRASVSRPRRASGH